MYATMKVIKKKKLWMGQVELRDYEIDRLIKMGKKVRIVVDDEYMDLTVAQLKKGQVNNTQYSKINAGQRYRLVGFDWHGTPYRRPDVEISGDVRKRLAQEFRKKYSKGVHE